MYFTFIDSFQHTSNKFSYNNKLNQNLKLDDILSTRNKLFLTQKQTKKSNQLVEVKNLHYKEVLIIEK